ncbi:unnamed protein product [Nippostrongylus brasiliensis]|uniref:Kinesin motor domain-containing protein n=1 Tax=Nippostrongylus brasiliensis TaxID=27835 RepID=A0A0N4YZA2_NIPBR|nr:unnamed protein product [Nippostrongylus brasiliensis]
MALAEALTNLLAAPITDLKALAVVGCAIDGGKDSLSMAARVGDELVKVCECDESNLIFLPVANRATQISELNSNFRRSDLTGLCIRFLLGEIPSTCVFTISTTSFTLHSSAPI